MNYLRRHCTNKDPSNPDPLRIPIIEITSRAALVKSSIPQKVLLHQTPIQSREDPRYKNTFFDSSLEALKPQLLSSKVAEGNDQANLAESVSEQKNWREALKSKLWRDAMTTEWNAILEKGTVTAVTRTQNMRPIRCRWIYKWKAHELRAKARVVVLGFMQDVEEQETFAPTAAYQSIRLIVHKAALMGWDLQQLDVNAAFLNADAPANTYMILPDGLDDLGFGIGKNEVFKLEKSLYGMATSPLAWFKTFRKSLLGYGLKDSRIEPCLYIIKDRLYVVVYVDDLLFTGEQAEVERFKQFISSAYKVKLQGQAHHFCGITLSRTSGVIRLSQSAYIEKMLQRFGMTDCKVAHTPMVDEPVAAESEFQDLQVSSTFPYRELVGSLMFLMTQTRPDLAFVLSTLSRHLHNFTEAHWTAAKRVLRYVKGTKHFAIEMKRTERKSHTLACYSDSDWANGADRKSVSGVVLTLDGTPFLWYSSKQTITALSSSEAELIALCEANKKIQFARQLLQDFDISFDIPMVIKGDNQASQLIAKKGVISRTKHLDLRRYYIKDSIDDGNILLEFVRTDENLADICTKVVKRNVLERLCDMLFYVLHQLVR